MGKKRHHSSDSKKCKFNKKKHFSSKKKKHCSSDSSSKECKVSIIETKHLSECSNEDVKICGIKGPLVVKVPVVLAQIKVQIDTESEIRLDEPALEIKRIRKNLRLTQCKLVPRAKKLFLAGFVRKNIEFATVKCSNKKGVSGDIRHTTVDIPFECVTKVDFVIDPEITCERKESATEIEIFDPLFLGKVPFERDLKDVECFVERPFCELVKAEIFEVDIEADGKPFKDCLPGEHTFQKITEKLVVLLTLKVLQNQQVFIEGKGKKGCSRKKECLESPDESCDSSSSSSSSSDDSDS